MTIAPTLDSFSKTYSVPQLTFLKYVHLNLFHLDQPTVITQGNPFQELWLLIQTETRDGPRKKSKILVQKPSNQSLQYNLI